jgi:hypothetical protein
MLRKGLHHVQVNGKLEATSSLIISGNASLEIFLCLLIKRFRGDEVEPELQRVVRQVFWQRPRPARRAARCNPLRLSRSPFFRLTDWLTVAVHSKMLIKRRVGLTLGLGRSLMQGVAPQMCVE